MSEVPTTDGGATAPAPAAPTNGASVLPPEWATKAADSVELAVALVNDRAVRPIVIGARAVVFGMLIVALAVAVLVWVSVAGIRFMDVYFWPGEVWASYLLLGGLFTAGGMVLWYLAISRSPTADT